jgi:putrescine transport system substrate-binding protein
MQGRPPHPGVRPFPREPFPVETVAMKHLRVANRLCAGALAVLSFTASAHGDLNILTWSDYFVGPEAVAAFAKAEDMNIKYAILDTDDTLQAKLLSGHSGYDVVYPSSTYIAKQIGAGVYQELDWAKIPNRANLDAVLMKKVAAQDPGNRFGVPYVWGTDGIVVNTTKAREALGRDARFDSWDLLFKPEVVQKLHKCGVSMVDSASDVFPVVLAYMGRNPNSKSPADYKDAFQVLRKIRPYIDQFSSTYLNDMAGGDMCIAMGWSGDAGVIRRRALQAHQKFEIRYVTPAGQTGLWFTMMGIPKDAANKDNAYKWINHMIDVKVAADITNAITYPTAVPDARKLVKAEFASDTTIFPAPADIESYFIFAPIDPDILHLITKMWLEFKADQ